MKLMIKSDAILKIKIDFSSERINKKNCSKRCQNWTKHQT